MRFHKLGLERTSIGYFTGPPGLVNNTAKSIACEHQKTINRESGMKVPKAWIPNNGRPVPRQATHGNSEDKKGHIAAVENQPFTAEHSTVNSHLADTQL